MPVSPGATSERFLRGIDRLIASVVSVLPLRAARRRTRLSRAWSAERGRDILIARVDVAGGFPGHLRWQHHLEGTYAHLTDSWLIVGEGTPSGFALPIDHLAGTAVQVLGGLQPPCLTVWFQDGDLIGSFSLGFLSTARGRSGLVRAEVWQQQLASLDVPVVPPETARFSPNVHVNWDDIADFVNDEVLYHGTAQASAGGWFATHLDAAEVWITANAILWCPAHGQGLNRLALDAIIECRSGFGDRLAIGVQDACGGRYDLYFDFGDRRDRAHHSANVKQLLADAGVPVSISPPVIAPWRGAGSRQAAKS